MVVMAANADRPDPETEGQMAAAVVVAGFVLFLVLASLAGYFIGRFL